MEVRELRSAGPARGVLRVPEPDGHIGSMRVLPSPTLSPFVHHFWWVRWKLRTAFGAEALPHPSAQLVFTTEVGTRRAEASGARTARLKSQRIGKGQAFGITFRAAMFQPLLGASMMSLTDRIVRARDVLGSEVESWARAIHAAPELEGKMTIAEAFLAPRLLPVQPEAARFRDLVERMASDRSLLRVEDAAGVAGLDVRGLQRAFRWYIGVTPKWVIRRYRLHEAAEQLKSRRPPPLAALAASLGYADQSHFAREFKLVVGQTPRSFARAWCDARRAR